MNKLLTKLLIISSSIFIPLQVKAEPSPIIQSMTADLGRTRPRNCPKRWCACYLNNKLRQIGKSPINSWLARDFARYGRPVKPAMSVIMVMRNHVGVVIGRCANGRIKLISGNHSRRVGVGCYSQSKAIAWRGI